MTGRRPRSGLETRARTVHLDDTVWDWTRDYAASIGTTISDVINTRLVDLHDDVEEPKR